MQLKIFTVYDAKVEAYLQPFYMQSKGAAIRAITECLNDPKHQFAKYPADYTLFEIGSWDDSNCKFDLHKAPVSLGVLLEFRSEKVMELVKT